jgi:hypothetical protein
MIAMPSGSLNRATVNPETRGDIVPMPRRVRSRKMPKGISGWLARDSHATKAASVYAYPRTGVPGEPCPPAGPRPDLT